MTKRERTYHKEQKIGRRNIAGGGYHVHICKPRIVWLMSFSERRKFLKTKRALVEPLKLWDSLFD